RQIESFQAFINLELTAQHMKVFPAFFILAPRIREHGVGVQVLGVYGHEPVLVRQGHHLGASFHPELTDDPLVHRYFISMVNESMLRC
ncbi:hypothetical protein LW980_17850, partial [Erwinia amylovora]|nr:hypothetical protein [Erwinia amylovora]